ncbi:MAG: hypothetical protein HYX92_21810 [Chloroflexi bacterium]|nr:hypothetical protein [Chloroflexota bacterium]
MVYRVLSPLGLPTVKAPEVAPRLSDLKGKTVCEIWNGLFRGQVSFPIIRELLQKRYPNLKVVPYTEFPMQGVVGQTAGLQERVEAAIALAIQKGCDAVISGNGF